jgi:putative AbiEii toxin of type IV toxin-antitoxin system/AAA domain-containing protein
MLRRLELDAVGPSRDLSITFGERLSVITGDNGVGKSFLLDVAWWALTRSWSGAAALPNTGDEARARIGYLVDGQGGAVEREIEFDTHRQEWVHGRGRPPITGFVVYARVDGSFAVMDPARNDPPDDPEEGERRRRPTAFYFDPSDVWSGLSSDGVQVCNGLIDDWRLWELEKKDEFTALTRSLALLSPEDGEKLIPGEPRRLDVLDAREIPTLRLPYGDVPVTHASAAVKRILALAYLLVWGWHEHRAASRVLGEPPSDRVTLLLDEVEAHLHPRWQRVILPSLLEAMTALGAPRNTQVICVTHAPLVLASLEDRWDSKLDRLFTLELAREQGVASVALREAPWLPVGDVNAWLTSDIFDLAQPRSLEAERLVQEAQAVMRTPGNGVASLGPILAGLSRHLSESDPLLARLEALAASEGVEIPAFARSEQAARGEG